MDIPELLVLLDSPEPLVAKMEEAVRYTSSQRSRYPLVKSHFTHKSTFGGTQLRETERERERESVSWLGHEPMFQIAT